MECVSPLSVFHIIMHFLETMPYQLPGMGVGLTHGSVSLPPPPPHINNGITHPPPPMGNIWKPPPEK